MEDDISRKMWAAITGEQQTEVTTISKENQMDYLKEHVNDVPLDVKRAIGRLLVNQGHIKAIVKVNDGSAVRLDTLPSAIIQQMYDILQFKLSKNNDALIEVTNGI